MDASSCLQVFQGTLSHMAPELLLDGRISKASDVYAFGILLWELLTGGHAFKGVPRALLGHRVAAEGLRPLFEVDAPLDYQLLACRCWESDPTIRCGSIVTQALYGIAVHWLQGLQARKP
jgi:serine/threonine protein kinase